MKAYSGFKSEAPAASLPPLPAGAYVGVIKDVRLEGDEPDQTLVLRLEVTEGEHAGYYTKRYQNDVQSSRDYTPRYKGVFRLRVPNPDNPNAAHPEWDVRSFNNAVWAIEESNAGYHWDWNEAGLKGRAVGFSVRDASFNGIPFTEIGRLEAVSYVREGKVKPMKPRPDTGSSNGASVPASPTVPGGFTPADDEELPF
ncbi:MAG: hypothetical protein IKE24_04465 [Clostridia bacterium]|nr:hypothetical protein [Clostridia bacterium]